MTDATTATTTTTDGGTFVAELARLLPDDRAWLIREGDDADTAQILVGDGLGAIRGTLDGRGFNVTVSDAPVREGWVTLLEVGK